MVDRNTDAQRLDQVRRGQTQGAAFAKRLVDERDLAVLEITQAAVNQATRNRRAAAAHVALFEYDDLQAAECRVASNTRAVDPGTDDGKVEYLLALQSYGLTCPDPRTRYL